MLGVNPLICRQLGKNIKRGNKMYALIEYKGKQYKAEKGAKLVVDKLSAEAGSKIDIDTVLLISDGNKISVGTPYVGGAKVSATVGNTFRDRKIIVYKEKSKKNYHRTKGHRQGHTCITIDDIVA